MRNARNEKPRPLAGGGFLASASRARNCRCKSGGMPSSHAMAENFTLPQRAVKTVSNGEGRADSTCPRQTPLLAAISISPLGKNSTPRTARAPRKKAWRRTAAANKTKITAAAAMRNGAGIVIINMIPAVAVAPPPANNKAIRRETEN